MTAFRISGEMAQRLASGHQDAFLRSRPSGCCVMRKKTTALKRRNGHDVPIPAIRQPNHEWPQGEPQTRYSF
jgi:hypothetical protein